MIISIKEKMEESNITRYELAKKVGVTYQTMDGIYKGKTESIKLDILEKICDQLKCTPNDILISNVKGDVIT